MSVTYAELGKMQFTDDQDLGITIAFKKSLEGLTDEQRDDAPQTVGEYLVARILDIVNSYAAQHVKIDSAPELRGKIDDAVKKGTPQQTLSYKQAVEAIYNLDLTPKIPDDVAPSKP